MFLPIFSLLCTNVNTLCFFYCTSPRLSSQVPLWNTTIPYHPPPTTTPCSLDKIRCPVIVTEIYNSQAFLKFRPLMPEQPLWFASCRHTLHPALSLLLTSYITPLASRFSCYNPCVTSVQLRYHSNTQVCATVERWIESTNNNSLTVVCWRIIKSWNTKIEFPCKKKQTN